MSKTCYECENCIYPPMCDNTLSPISDAKFAEMCAGFTQIQKPPKSIFDWLTSSEETLAKNSIYFRVSQNGEHYTYSSPWIDTVHETEAEAIAATVDKLKEVKVAEEVDK